MLLLINLISTRLAISMRMSKEYSVNFPQSIFGEPFYGGGLKVLAHVYHQCPVVHM